MSTNEPGDFSSNPYQSSAPTPVVPGDNKPASITVFGILNIVFAIMGFCGVVAFVVQTTVVGSQTPMNNPIFELTNSPVYFGFTVVQMVLGFVANILLLVGGIGLLGGKPYGRTLAIIWAIFQLFFAVVSIIFTAIFLMLPLIERAGEMPEGPEKVGLIVGGVSATAGGLCAMIYPIVLLIFMMRAPVVNYMRAQRQL